MGNLLTVWCGHQSFEPATAKHLYDSHSTPSTQIRSEIRDDYGNETNRKKNTSIINLNME